MNKYVEIIKLLERIFGKGAVSKSLGTRTNVVRFPKGKQPLDPTTRHFDVEATAEKNPELVNTIKNSIEDRMGDITKMNDQELLTYKQNLQRLADHVNPPLAPAADVIEAGSKQRVTGEGLEKLIEEAGQTARPGTLMGNLESRINKLKALSKEGVKTEDILKDFATGQQGMAKLQDEGLVRATARQILINDIKAGKIKNMTVEEAINMKEPIEPFRTLYGEGALEQLDSLIPEFRSLKTETEAEKLARSKFEFEPKLDRPKESYTKEELEDIFKKMKDEPENKADGGSIGLDYLMGFDNRPKYAGGGDVKKILDLIAKANKELKGKKSMEGVNPKTGEITVPKESITTAEKKYYFYDTNEEYDKLITKHKKAAAAHDELDNIDIYDKIAPDQLGEVIAEMAGKNVDRLTDAQRMKYYRIAQSYLNDFIKVDRTRKAVENFNQGLELSATDRRYLKFAQPVDSLPATKSFDISDDETAKALTDFARENDPEGFKKIQKIVDDINNRNTLENFDIKNREPNANGGPVGLNYLLGL